MKLIGKQACSHLKELASGTFYHFCDLDHVLLLSVLRCGYEVILFSSCLVAVTEQPCLLLVSGDVMFTGEHPYIAVHASPVPGSQGLLFFSFLTYKRVAVIVFILK